MCFLSAANKASKVAPAETANNIPLEQETAEKVPKNIEVSLDEDDFVLVMYQNDRENSAPLHYIGKCTAVKAGSYTIKFLRPYQGRKNEFSFPPLDDLDDIFPTSVVKKLETPLERRGRFIFSKNVLP